MPFAVEAEQTYEMPSLFDEELNVKSLVADVPPLVDKPESAVSNPKNSISPKDELDASIDRFTFQTLRCYHLC
jgi:hypothetical protein